MDKINKIKQHMAKLGWTVEEKIGGNGWRNTVGYYIKFSRCDWHGKFTISLTGHAVYFIGITQNAFDYNAVLNTVHNTAKKGKESMARIQNLHTISNCQRRNSRRHNDSSMVRGTQHA